MSEPPGHSWHVHVLAHVLMCDFSRTIPPDCLLHLYTMQKYLDIIAQSYSAYASYLWQEITHPHWENYFYWLIGVSLFFWLVEIAVPWRKKQSFVRKDFWLDAFYMFFNFFIFSLVGFHAASSVVVELFNDFLAGFGIENLVAIKVAGLAIGWQFLIMFLMHDFLSWGVHLLLHRVPILWEFHKVHHSVEEMGFAAHLRYHWMENVVYRTLKYLPLAMVGFGIQEYFIMHIFNLAIGHFNHTNVKLPLGPLKYLFNNPQMHIWHHARHLPEGKRYGVNFAITLSVWDYLFGTAWIPESGRDIPLGFPKLESFPKKFMAQQLWPFAKSDQTSG